MEVMGTPSARYQDRRNEILRVASAIFAEKGYHRASMRDIAGATGSSLAGLYHYFPTKEQILYEISARAFDTVLEGAAAGERVAATPADRLRSFVHNHVAYFVGHLTEMKVLSHESDSLGGEYRALIQERKRRYVALATAIVGGLPGAGARAERDLRLPVLALFGMMNWIYTWYRSAGDGDIELIAATMSDIFLGGFAGAMQIPGGNGDAGAAAVAATRDGMAAQLEKG
jgi:AcrR family transcriptional regulator